MVTAGTSLINSEGSFDVSKYEKIIVLCGGNYDRKQLLKIYDALAEDKDLIDVSRFKIKFARSYIKYLMLIVIGILMTSVFGLPIFPPLFSWIIFVSGILIMIYPLIKTIIGLKFDIDIQKVIAELRKKDPNKLKTDHAILNEFRKSVNQTYYDHPASCWRPLEGHVSDAQTAMCLVHAVNEMSAKKPDISLVYAGEPYYSNLFIDSISISIVGSKCVNDEIRKLKKVIEECIENHTIRYYLTACFKSNFETNTNRLNHGAYVFGIRFLSQFISDFRDRYYGINSKQKMRVCIDEKHILPDSEKSRAIEYLLRASSSPEVLEFIREEDIENSDVMTIKINDLIYMRETEEKENAHPNTRNRKNTETNLFHLPIKLPIVLAKKSDGDNNPAISGALLGTDRSKKTLIFAIGGTEQNMAIIPFVVNQFWSMKPSLRGVGLNENLFSTSSWNLGTEDLVYSARRRARNYIGNDIVPRETSGSIKTSIYSFDNVRHDRRDMYKKFEDSYDKDHYCKLDLIGIYGCSAAATKMVSMLLFKELFCDISFDNEQTDKTNLTNIYKLLCDDVDDSLLFNITRKGYETDKRKLLDFWDENDFINNFHLVHKLIDEIEIKMIKELNDNEK